MCVSLLNSFQDASAGESTSLLGSSGSDSVFLVFEGRVGLVLFFFSGFLFAGLLVDAFFWSLDLLGFLMLESFLGLI